MAKPTINDVARVAGVSKKTVSRVINQSPLLNEATRARVEEVIAQLGYVPDPQARALALRRNAGAPAATDSAAPPARSPAPAAQSPAPAASARLIALVYDGGAAPLLADVQHGMLAALAGSDFALAPCLADAAGDAEGQLRDFLQRHRPAGVLLLPPLAEFKLLGKLCEELECPHLCLGTGPDNDAPVVAATDREAAATAVEYLISLGHERIGIVAGPDDSRLAQQRELGYLDAMADHDLDRGPALIATGDHSFQSGFAAGQLLLEVSPRPTAIFAGNDEMAAGVLHAALQKGIKVPEALSIVGFDDTAIAARLCPQLTTVRVPVAEMAEAAARRLIDPQAADGTPQRFVPEFVARGSAGPCPA